MLTIAKDFGMDMSTEKTKIMASQAKYPVRSSICVSDKNTEQVSCFKYLGYYVV
jgi:hypothetical protein